MATVASKAIRRSNAQARIEAAAAVLGERFGVSPPAPVLTVVRDPELRRAAEQERMADLLEAVVAATEPKAPPAPPKPEPVKPTKGRSS